MRKLCFNKPFLFSLVTAFLFLQWSATHIHLAGEHEHDGDQHQHSATAHQHQLTSHHADVIDVANEPISHVDNNKVVELAHVCTQFHGKLGEQFAFVVPASWNPNLIQQPARNTIYPVYQDSYQSFHQYTSIRLRAPPVYS